MGVNGWLERRLGVVGQTRQRIVSDIASFVADERRSSALVTEAEVDALVQRAPKHLAVLFPNRGERDCVRRIVSYGAMLGIVAAGAESPLRGDVVFEAAMFNLGVALFDTVVDDHVASIPTLTAALRPDQISHAMRTGERIARVEHAWANAIIDAFEAMARNVQGHGTACIDDLGRMLVDMHASEMSPGNRLQAKLLPTRFIGLLGDASGATTRLFESLAEFVALWDDWQDLADDLISGRANLFVGDNALARILCGALRIATGPLSRAQLRRRLVSSARRVLADADVAGRGAEARQFIAALLPER